MILYKYNVYIKGIVYMIDRIIAELIDNMVGANIISKEAKDAYIYAYTIVLERILTLITIGIAGIALHRFVYIVVFICTFMMLRRRTGGFHLETFGQCFIENQPENPWSLDRGMNGVMSQVHIFLLKILYFSKIHTIIYIQENLFPSL